MRINYKNWPVLKGLKDFNKLLSIRKNYDELKERGSDYFNLPIFRNNISCIRKTFEEDTYKNKEKLWDLFENEILINDKFKIEFEHSGIFLKSNRAVWYYFNKKRKVYTVDVFLIDGAFCGSAAIMKEHEESDNLALFTKPNKSHLSIFENKVDINHSLESELRMAILNVMFRQFTDIKTKHLKPNEKHVDKKLGHKDLNETDFDITILDSTWYTNLIRSEGFKVTGHPRLQPCKEDGEWTYKLIWINEYMKHGYARTAKKLTQEEIA